MSTREPSLIEQYGIQKNQIDNIINELRNLNQELKEMRIELKDKFVSKEEMKGTMEIHEARACGRLEKIENNLGLLNKVVWGTFATVGLYIINSVLGVFDFTINR